MEIKLWVDDIRQAPYGWHHARTISAAIEALASFDVTEVSLDHDISHQVQVGKLSRPYPCEETYQPVAHYLGLKYKAGDKPPKITLHTSNPVGAKELKGILDRYGLTAEVKPYRPANRLEMEM